MEFYRTWHFFGTRWVDGAAAAVRRWSLFGARRERWGAETAALLWTNLSVFTELEIVKSLYCRVTFIYSHQCLRSKSVIDISVYFVSVCTILPVCRVWPANRSFAWIAYNERAQEGKPYSNIICAPGRYSSELNIFRELKQSWAGDFAVTFVTFRWLR